MVSFCLLNHFSVLALTFTGWLKVLPGVASFLLHYLTRSTFFFCRRRRRRIFFVHVTTGILFLASQREQNCSCVSYQILSPVIHIHVQHCLSPLQLLPSWGMTQFLFIIIMHSLPAWIDYTRATLCPQFHFLPGGM